MKSDPENFDPLLRLLRVKRYEQPPPGYFESFSRGVLARLKADETQRLGESRDIAEEASWLRWLWSVLEAKPILAGVFGVVVSGLVLAGIIYSQSLEQTSVLANSPTSDALLTGAPKTWTFDQQTPMMLLASTNPIIEPRIPGSVFDLFRPVPQPANFNP